MSNHGTACTPGQFGEIGGNIIRALPKAIQICEREKLIPVAKIARYCQEGERLSRALAEAFSMMYGGHAALAAPVGQVIDCDAQPPIPTGYSAVEEHQKGGRFVWDPFKVNLYLSDDQREGTLIEGNKLRKELAGKPVLNVNILNYLLTNRHLIPEEWKGICVFFWGTVYRHFSGDLSVPGLGWYDGDWGCDYYWLKGVWRRDFPAAVRVS